MTRDQSQHTLAQPDPGKARVYFIHDAGTDNALWYPTVKVAIDGSWVGANHSDSYLSASVEPGEHHVCVTLQSSVVGQRVALAHFTAEADKIYYYRTLLLVTGRGSIELLELDPIDSDQGKYLVGSFPLSVSSPNAGRRPGTGGVHRVTFCRRVDKCHLGPARSFGNGNR